MQSVKAILRRSQMERRNMSRDKGWTPILVVKWQITRLDCAQALDILQKVEFMRKENEYLVEEIRKQTVEGIAWICT
jgi:hypothetical protein